MLSYFQMNTLTENKIKQLKKILKLNIPGGLILQLDRFPRRTEISKQILSFKSKY